MSPLASATVLPCSRASSRRACPSRLARAPGTSSSRGRGAAGWWRPRPAARPWRSRRAAPPRPSRRARPARHLAGHRLEDVAEAARGALHLLAADEMADLAHAALLPARPAVRGRPSIAAALSLTNPHGYRGNESESCENKNGDPGAMSRSRMSRFDWDDLRFFLAVARAGRLTVAARRLGADHATVSPHIGARGALKAKLFERRPQGYALTDHGERLLAKAGDMETRRWRFERDRRSGSRPLGHRPHRDAGRLRHLFPRRRTSGAAALSGSRDPARRDAAPSLPVEARGRRRRLGGAAEGGQDRRPQAHGLPARPLRTAAYLDRHPPSPPRRTSTRTT